MTPLKHEEVLQRLADIGLSLPDAPVPLASYTPTVVAGNFAFTSGQLPLVDGDLSVTGKVGDGEGLVSPTVARDLAAKCALNCLAALTGAIADLGRVAQIVKITGFVASDPGFSGQPGVIDGASDLLNAALGPRGVHSRSAVGVAALPKDSPVELEMIALLS